MFSDDSFFSDSILTQALEAEAACPLTTEDSNTLEGGCRSQSSSPVLSRSRRSASCGGRQLVSSSRKRVLQYASGATESPGAISKGVDSLQLCGPEEQRKDCLHDNSPVAVVVVADADRRTSPSPGRSTASKLAKISTETDVFDDSFDDLLCTVAAQVESQFGTLSANSSTLDISNVQIFLFFH